MKPDELAKLIGVEEIEVKKFLAKEEIMNIEENHPMSREECVIVASHFINKLRLRVDKQGQIRKGLVNVFSFKRTDALFKFLDNDK
jgi:ssDNA-binding replication factor A large subunit